MTRAIVRRGEVVARLGLVLTAVNLLAVAGDDGSGRGFDFSSEDPLSLGIDVDMLVFGPAEASRLDFTTFLAALASFARS